MGALAGFRYGDIIKLLKQLRLEFNLQIGLLDKQR